MADINQWQFPRNEADKVIGWSSNGKGMENKTVPLLGLSLASEIRDFLDTPPYVATRTALKALDTTKDRLAVLTEAGRVGMFKWTTGDFTSQIAADTQEGIFVKADAIASSSGAWVRDVRGKVIYAEHFGVSPGTDVTAAAKALYDGLSNAVVIWSPGTYDLTDYILVNGDYVTTCCLAGRDAINIRQKTWGLPCFSTADPSDTSVRPNGVRFLDMGGEAWNNGVKCYFYDAFYGPGSSGPYTCSADTSATASKVYLFRNEVLETPGSISGLGTGTITVTLSTPQSATDYICIKVTNKDDLFGQTSLWIAGSAQKGSDSAFVFHGGGDDFTAERLSVEGFVCPLSIWGDWTSNDDGRQSKRLRLNEIKSNICDFTLVSEITSGFVAELHANKISETQTDTGLTVGVAATYKDPHTIYWTNNGTAAYTSDLYVGRLTGDNKYSSIYKFRNVKGIRIDAGAIRQYHRVIDIENCESGEIRFPHISGAFNDHYDLQRSALNIYGCTALSFKIGQMYVTSDTAFALRFLYGFDGVGRQHHVEIDELFISGSALRTQPWIISHGASDCFVHIKTLNVLGEMPTYLYRAREDNDSFTVATNRGGIRIDRIVATSTNPTLKLAQLSSGNGAAHPSNMRLELGKRTLIGGSWDAATVDDDGTSNRVIVDGQERITLSAVVCSFATNGDAVFTPSNFTYDAFREGDYVEIDAAFSLATSAFTTASGAFEMRFTGMPAASTDRGEWGGNVVDLRGVDLGTTTRHLGARLNSAGNYITIRETGDDNSGGTVAATGFAPAGASDYVVALKIRYRAAA